MNPKKTRLLFCLISLCLAAIIAAVLIPRYRHALHLDRVTLRALVSDRPMCAVYLGDTAEISVSLVPQTALTKLSFTIEDNSVATIEAVEGGDFVTITAAEIGDTIITVTGDSNVSLTIPIKVIRKPVPPDSGLPELYDENILIANLQTSLSADYAPDLVPFPANVHVNKSGMQVEPTALEAYKALCAAAFEATGQNLIVISGYRSYQHQASLYNGRVASLRAQGLNQSDAERITGQTTQPPGKSEHQLGVSIDIGTSAALSNTFDQTKLGEWVHRHAHEYGFILRYPRDKTEITGISYEPWHFRYVGVEHASYIYNHGICLEEYVNLQQEARLAADEYASRVSADDYLTLIS